MDGANAWVPSALGGAAVAVAAYTWTSSSSYAFVCGIVYLVAVRALLLQPELLVGPKTSLETARWGAMAGALLVFVATSVDAGLVPGVAGTSLEVIVVVIGVGTATCALGMQYRAALDAE